MAAFGLMQNGSEGVQVLNDRVKFVPVDERYKEYLIYMKRLYNEGLIDSQILVHTVQEFTQKGKDNKLGVVNGLMGHNIFNMKPDETPEKMAPFSAMISPVNNQPVFPRMSAIRKGNFAITSKSAHPEEIIRWVDFFFTAKGQFLGQYGVVLDDEFLNDPNKKFSAGSNIDNEEVKKSGLKLTEYTGHFLTHHGLPGVAYDQEMNDSYIASRNVAGQNQRGREIYDPVSSEPYPSVNFTLEEIELLQTISNDIKTYIDEMHARFILDNYSFDNWDNYVNTFKSLNIDKYLEVYQQAYDRWKSNN
jgi:putative aldouronate transport system substrate-binding protein